MSSWNRFPNAESFPEFIKEMKRQEQNTDQIRVYNLPNVNFSNEQQDVILLFEKQIDFIKNGGRQPCQVTIVQGKAGSGKSTVIQHLTGRLADEFGSNSFALLAPTGAAAININGTAIHSKLRIRPKNATQLPLSNFTLHTFQQEFAECQFIIIDQYSMFSCRLLYFIDQRCTEATAQNRKLFGGMFVFLLGDLKQLTRFNSKTRILAKTHQVQVKCLHLKEAKLDPKLKKHFHLRHRLRHRLRHPLQVLPKNENPLTFDLNPKSPVFHHWKKKKKRMFQAKRLLKVCIIRIK